MKHPKRAARITSTNAKGLGQEVGASPAFCNPHPDRIRIGAIPLTVPDGPFSADLANPCRRSGEGAPATFPFRLALPRQSPTCPGCRKESSLMTDAKLPLIHKAPVEGLTIHVARTRMAIGDPASLDRLPDGKVGVFAEVRQMLFGLLPRQRLTLLGHLGPLAEEIVAPSLAHGDPLRVRIIDLVPEHLSNGFPPEVYISVWGDPRHLNPVLQATGLVADPEPPPARRPTRLFPVQGT
jgi:hypothetical protein